MTVANLAAWLGPEVPARVLAHMGASESLPGTILIFVFFLSSIVLVALALRMKSKPEFQRAEARDDDRPGGSAERAGRFGPKLKPGKLTTVEVA